MQLLNNLLKIIDQNALGNFKLYISRIDPVLFKQFK